MFVLVRWIADKPNTYSVQRAESVVDSAMLTNPDLSGVVKFTGESTKEPKAGWREYPAKILAINGWFLLCLKSL